MSPLFLKFIFFKRLTCILAVVRSQRAESKEVAKCERRREQLADKVYSQVQAELQQEQTKHKCSAKKFALKHVPTLTSGEELSDILENASDPVSIQVIYFFCASFNIFEQNKFRKCLFTYI